LLPLALYDHIKCTSSNAGMKLTIASRPFLRGHLSFAQDLLLPVLLLPRLPGTV